MKHLPTTKQLRYFIALDEHRHFGKAAAACFVTQSAFSVAIQELENLLNLCLVDRTNRSVTITPIGSQVASQARLALFDIEGIVDLASAHQEPLSGPLRIGIIPTIAPFILPILYFNHGRKVWVNFVVAHCSYLSSYVIKGFCG